MPKDPYFQVRKPLKTAIERHLYFCENHDKIIAKPLGFELKLAGPSQMFGLTSWLSVHETD